MERSLALGPLNSFELLLSSLKGFPHGASGKESSSQCRRHKSLGFNPLEEEMGPPLQYSSLIAQLVKNLPAMQEIPV